MMRRHGKTKLIAGVLMLLVVGTGVAGGWAAETKAASPVAAPAVVAPGAGAKTVPVAPSTAVLPGSKANETPAPASAAAMDGNVPPLAPPGFIYSTVGKADPFTPFIDTNPPPPSQKKAEGEVKKKVVPQWRSISPLQQSEVEQFKLVGIVGNDRARTAMVEDGVAKKYYPLSMGTYIGMNEGRVVSILPDRVIVEEKLVIEGKKTQTRRMTLMLHKENEGKP